MAIMDMIRRMGERKSISKEKFKEAQENLKIQTMLDERQKSSNQREIERHFKEEKEEDIKKQLDGIRQKKNKDNWKGTNLLKGSSILKDDNPILKQKNIFKHQKSNMFKGGHQFFK